jgi:hypothetical protein
VSNVKSGKKPEGHKRSASYWFRLGLFLGPEDGGDMSLRIMSFFSELHGAFSPNYTVLHLRRQHKKVFIPAKDKMSGLHGALGSHKY